MKLNKFELLKCLIGANTFMVTNSTGPSATKEWDNLRSKLKKELLEKHNFIAK